MKIHYQTQTRLTFGKLLAVAFATLSRLSRTPKLRFFSRKGLTTLQGATLVVALVESLVGAAAWGTGNLSGLQIGSGNPDFAGLTDLGGNDLTVTPGASTTDFNTFFSRYQWKYLYFFPYSTHNASHCQ